MITFSHQIIKPGLDSRSTLQYAVQYKGACDLGLFRRLVQSLYMVKVANKSGRGRPALNGGQLLGFQVHGPKVEKVGLAFHSTSSTLPNPFLSLTSN